MRKVLKKLRVVNIDVFIYTMSDYVSYNVPDFKYIILTENMKDKTRFYIKDSEVLVHESYLYSKVFLLRSIGKRGPVIGDCFTNEKYRGQSIYPYVINQIAKEVLESKKKGVFMVVNRNNSNSIKGIEKAGYNKYASIKATRWLWIYIKHQVDYFN